MTLTTTRRKRRRRWCCIGVKCSSTVLPAGNYAMYVGLGCLSTTTVPAANNATHTRIVNTSSYASLQQIHEILLEYTLCVCVCVCVCVRRHKAQLVWYMKHKQHSCSCASHQQLHYTHTYKHTHVCIYAYMYNSA